MTTEKPDTSPFTIRKKGKRWEVAVVDKGTVFYIDCGSKALAEALADARPLVAIEQSGGKCESKRVRRCLDAYSVMRLQDVPLYQVLLALQNRLLGEL